MIIPKVTIIIRMLKHLFILSLICLSTVYAEDLDTLLLTAAEKGDAVAIKNLIEKGAKIEARDKEGRTPIMLAAKGGFADAVITLVTNGAEVDAMSSTKRTAIYCAAFGGKTKIVEYLISKGAQVDISGVHDSGGHGRTPLTAALLQDQRPIAKEILKDYLATAEALIKGGAHLEYPNGDGETALMFVAGRGKLELVKFLLAKGADVNAKGKRAQTALFYAAWGGHLETVKLLLTAGADPHVGMRNWEYKHFNVPPILKANDIAKEKGHKEIEALILEAQKKSKPSQGTTFP
jgi:ankyrin repeat protein